jgi:YHS domain-containing protein
MTDISNSVLRKRKSDPRQFVTLCGRIFRDTDPAYFPRAEYRGRTIMLCTESCLGAFLADPDLFYKAHRNSEKGKEYGIQELAPVSTDSKLSDST